MSYSISKLIQAALNKGYTLHVVTTVTTYTPDRLPSPREIGNILAYSVSKDGKVVLNSSKLEEICKFLRIPLTEIE
jgi:hypothetical protein